MLCISIPINERRYELHISQRLREEVKFVNQLIVFTFVEQPLVNYPTKPVWDSLSSNSQPFIIIAPFKEFRETDRRLTSRSSRVTRRKTCIKSSKFSNSELAFGLMRQNQVYFMAGQISRFITILQLEFCLFIFIGDIFSSFQYHR